MPSLGSWTMVTITVLCGEQPHAWDQQSMSEKFVVKIKKNYLNIFKEIFISPVMQGNERTEKITFAQDNLFLELILSISCG